MSTGTIRTLNPGVIDINPAEGGGAINFTETPPSNVVVGSDVNFEIDTTDPKNPVAINITLLVVNTPPPPPLTTTVTTDTAGTPFVNTGETLIITNGATLTGSITLKGGTLNINQNATLTGDIIAIAGSTIILENATIGGDVDVFDGAEVRITGGTHNGDLNIKRTAKVTRTGGTHNGDILAKRSQTVLITGTTTTGGGDIRVRKSSVSSSVTNNIISGDLILKANTNCTTASGGVPNSNTVTGKNAGCKA